jgi:outer membrane murein-binding lipoprotein Lpp
MRKILVFTVFAFLVILQSVEAISVLDGQELISRTMVPGMAATEIVVIKNSDGAVITADGDAGAWISFAGETSISIPAGDSIFLKFNITVTEGHSLGVYEGRLLADNQVLSHFSIEVTEAYDEVEKLKALADVNSRIEALDSNVQSTMNSKLNTMESNMKTMKDEISGAINDIHDYKRIASELETSNEQLSEEVSSLQTKISSLEGEKNQLQTERNDLELTGNIVRGESAVLFVVGLIVGMGVVYLFFRKLNKYF